MLRILFLAVTVSILLLSCATTEGIKQSEPKETATNQSLTPYTTNSDIDKMIVKIIVGYNLRNESYALGDGQVLTNPYYSGVEGLASGSGMYVSNNGLIITNRHVIDGFEAVLVKASGEKEFAPAKVVYIDQKEDLAVLFTGHTPEKYFSLDSNKIVSNPIKGSPLFVIGYPLDSKQEEASVTAGIFSRTVLDVDPVLPGSLYLTDAAINSGNSGGPVFNSAGHFVGLAVAVLIDYSKKIYAESSGIVIPAKEVVRAINSVSAESLKIDAQYKKFSKTLDAVFHNEPRLMRKSSLKEKCEDQIAGACLVLSAMLWNECVKNEISVMSIKEEAEKEKVKKRNETTRSLSYHYFLKYKQSNMNLSNNFILKIENEEKYSSIIKQYSTFVENFSKEDFEKLWSLPDEDLEKTRKACANGSADECFALAEKLDKTHKREYVQYADEIINWLMNIGYEKAKTDYFFKEAENLIEQYKDLVKASKVAVFHEKMSLAIKYLSDITEKSEEDLINVLYLQLLKNGLDYNSIEKLGEIKSIEMKRLRGHIELMKKGNPREYYFSYIESASPEDREARFNRLIKEIENFQNRFDMNVDVLISDIKTRFKSY